VVSVLFDTHSFHFAFRVYLILDEYMLAGEIEETSKREILDRVKFLEKLD
jgi:hypothetical protein